MTGPRAAARKTTTNLIISSARDQVTQKGAANLSLREIARDLGMASSAMYRYFESRDQLLTELIIRSYDEIGSLVEEADSRCSRHDLPGRWMSISKALREWALANPSDYGLIFGTPVPWYEAPDDTTTPGQRYTDVLVRLLVDAHASGRAATVAIPATKGISREYSRVRKNLGADLPDEMLLAGLAAWAAMLGAISLEVFGHVGTIFDNPGIHFAALVEMLGGQLLGLA